MNTTQPYQAKDKSTLLLFFFILYAVAFATVWTMHLSGGLYDLSFVFLLTGCYFRFARKKLSDGNKVKKYNTKTRNYALFIIYFSVFMLVVPVLFFVLGS